MKVPGSEQLEKCWGMSQCHTFEAPVERVTKSQLGKIAWKDHAFQALVEPTSTTKS